MFTLDLQKNRLPLANINLIDSIFPDPRKAMLKWNGQTQTTPGTYTPSNFSAVMTVGGTPINSLCEVINIDQIFSGQMGNNIGSNILLSGSSNSTTDVVYNMTYRVGLIGTLAGGEVVGETIRSAMLVSAIRTGQNVTITPNELSITVKLLKTDGTLTTVGTIVFLTGGVTEYSITSSSFDVNFGLKKYTGSGVVASPGDMIVCDINFVSEIRNSSTANVNSVGIYPGYAGSPVGWTQINGNRAICVSVR